MLFFLRESLVFVLFSGKNPDWKKRAGNPQKLLGYGVMETGAELSPTGGAAPVFDLSFEDGLPVSYGI